MPTRRRGGATEAFLAVQDTSPFEDTVDGPHRGERLDPAALEGLVDGLRPMESQVAELFQLSANGQDQFLDDGLGPVGCPGAVRPVVPVHSVESLTLSMLGPVMDHGLTDVELMGGVVLG